MRPKPLAPGKIRVRHVPPAHHVSIVMPAVRAAFVKARRRRLLRSQRNPLSPRILQASAGRQPKREPGVQGTPDLEGIAGSMVGNKPFEIFKPPSNGYLFDPKNCDPFCPIFCASNCFININRYWSLFFHK